MIDITQEAEECMPLPAPTAKSRLTCWVGGGQEKNEVKERVTRPRSTPNMPGISAMIPPRDLYGVSTFPELYNSRSMEDKNIPTRL